MGVSIGCWKEFYPDSHLFVAGRVVENQNDQMILKHQMILPCYAGNTETSTGLLLSEHKTKPDTGS